MHLVHDVPTNLALVLPVELYHEIFLLVDIKDILSLRKTCKHFFALTQEHDLWSMIFARLRAAQALPFSRAGFVAMSSTQAERALFAASKVEALFLGPRGHAVHQIPPANTSTSSWRMLMFISDRFLLSVNQTAVTIWDTSTVTSLESSPTVASTPWANFTLSDIIDFVDCYSTLYIAVSRIDMNQRSALIYSVHLPPSGESENHACLHQEAELPMHEGELLKHLDPYASRALLYSAPGVLHVLYWGESNRRTTILMPVRPDDLDNMWNGITSLRFCGPYILCFRPRSVEAYPIPADTSSTNPLPVFRHRFGPVCFRAVSLSHVRVSRCPSGETYTIFMLTSDIYKGMFHYRIRVTTAPVPSMSVTVLAQGSIQPAEPLPVNPGTDIQYTLNEMFERMFVPTWSLGSVGLRGVWVDRQRGSIDRRVVAFTTDPRRLCTKAKDSEADSARDTELVGDVRGALDEAPTMEGKVIRVISSYDLRDDITICAVSEWTGRIATVSRAGSILLF